MTFELALLGALAGIAVLCGLVVMIRHERDAWLGSELRRAAGSESAARMAIESANLDRLLSQKYENEFERTMRRKPARNVLQFPPITNRGRPIHFTNDGDSAA